MKEENEKLKHENAKMKTIYPLIKFYSEVMEKGVDAEYLLRDNNEL